VKDPVLLTVNAGSSTIKLGLFGVGAEPPRRLGKALIDLRHQPVTLRFEGDGGPADQSLRAPGADLQAIVEEVLAWLAGRVPLEALAGVGHRVVHGGDHFGEPVAIDAASLDAIEALVPLAPLHQPRSVALIRAIRRQRPRLGQAASFDTAFHRTQDALVRRFALPRALFEAGVKRYGFHGLSYKFIAGQLAHSRPALADKRVVVAHLGSGASLCALEGGVSRDTSMSFSTLDGIPMATRCGALDPGVAIHLMKTQGLSVEALEDLLYNRSGLLGVSGISADSRVLLESEAPEAREALDLFTFRIAREVAALANTVGGLDALVFTAGIGEHQPPIRAAVCRRLAWLGVTLDDTANAGNAAQIDGGGPVAVLVVPTDEEQVIAEEAWSVFAGKPAPAAAA